MAPHGYNSNKLLVGGMLFSHPSKSKKPLVVKNSKNTWQPPNVFLPSKIEKMSTGC
jgi:hypothetical protein